MAQITGYVGTYRSPQGAGTYGFFIDSDTGALSAPACVFSGENTKYAACLPGRVLTLAEREGQAGLCLLEAGHPQAPLLDALFPEAVTACTLSCHQGKIYTANYHDGTVLEYEQVGDRLQLTRRLLVENEAGCHQIIPHGRWMLIPCLELDRVYIYDREADWVKVGEIPFEQGVGPRHGVFNADHTRFFLNSERSNQLFSFSVQDKNFICTDVQSILPQGFQGKGDTAALRLAEDGRFLYTTVRGGDLISVFAVTEGGTQLIAHVPSGGTAPWDLALVPGGRFALVSNRGSSTVVSLPIAPDGRLGAPCSSIAVPQPVGIAMM